jgi:hypothetical protein
MRPAQRLRCALCGLLLLSLGCVSGSNTRKKSSAKIAKNVTSSAPELSSRNQSLLAFYSAEIETAADKIISEAPSRTARRQALEWKAEAIPVLQTSLLNTDPIAAVLDTWSFIFQMSAYMERPALKQALGDSHAIVAETVKNMNVEIERNVRLGSPTADVADLRQWISNWADAHPIQASLAGRRSLDPDLISKAEQSDLGTMDSLKGLSESIGDLAARLDSYNAYAPKQARWQAELLLGDVTRDPQVSAALSNFVALSNTAAKASSNMDRMPELVGQAREAVRADIEGQRLSVQAFVNEQRLQTLDALQQERIATIAALRGERLAATADMRGERQVVLDALHNDEVAAMNDVNAMRDKAIQDLDARGRGLIDHFFIRALELMLLAFVLCSPVVWMLLRRSPEKASKRGEKFLDRVA